MKLKKTIDKINAGQELKIIALGDSLTYGWMVNKGYLDFLEEMLSRKYPENKITIINKGVPGDTAEEGRQRLEKDVISYSPDLLFIQFALNDAFSGYSVTGFSENISVIIAEIKKQTRAEILLMTSSPLDQENKDLIKDYYEALLDIAKKESVEIVCIHEYLEQKMADGIDVTVLFQADAVHPEEQGYQFMAEAIFKYF